jgi:hypothetical protein
MDTLNDISDPDLNRKTSGKFSSGRSGNPIGRPKGIPDRRTEWRKYLEPHIQSLIEKAVELALSGDTNALKLCLERVVPRTKDEFISIDLSSLDLQKAEALLCAGKIVLAEVGAGNLTPAQGNDFAALLESQRKLIETANIDARLKEIECLLKNRANKL